MTDFDRLRRIAEIIRDLRQKSCKDTGIAGRVVFQLTQADEINWIYALALGEDEKWMPDAIYGGLK